LTSWRPWTRTLAAHTPPLPADATVDIKVAGTTEPLRGSEVLFQDRLAAKCRDALSRHGISTVDHEGSYHALLQYHTTRHETLAMTSTTTSNSSSGTAVSAAVGAGAGASAYGGAVGASIAEIVSRAFTANSTTARTAVSSAPSYSHALALEVQSSSGEVVWKGDANWESGTVDLAVGGDVALQLLVSDLKSESKTVTRADEIKGTHVLNYYRLYCADPVFGCPGLPYQIAFEQVRSVPGDIKDGYAVAAYLDLVQHAEIALPMGRGKAAWSDPLDQTLWSDVELGGRYVLGPGQKPVAVLVQLTTSSMRLPGGTCYLVSGAHVATEEEYAKFEGDLGEWRAMLERYLDVTVH
jgi:hypothetical protein